MNEGEKSESPARNALMARSLEASGQLPTRELARALGMADARGVPLEQVLLELRLIDEETLLPLVCAALGIGFAAAPWEEGARLDPDAVLRLSPAYLGAKAVAPLLSLEHEPQTVLMATPGDTELRRELEFHLGRPVAPRGATLRTIRMLLARGQAEEAGSESDPEADGASRRGLSAPPEAEGPVIRFVNEKLADAVALGASDIHFESTESGLVVRMRVNGLLSRQEVDPGLGTAAILARLKVMAQADVSERRLPQDARMRVPIAGRVIDFRFSSLPTQHGESIALRVLDPQALRQGWEDLGFAPDLVARIVRAIEHPNGLFLVTGPTGSGKTTTLYTALRHLNSPRTKIVTVEDPVEYELPGVQQVQVQEAIGLSFARVLRSILRHDPNVIMIGEIRDQETAAIACRAAQVGRMVLSTLHANSAEAAATRLGDLGVPDYLVRDVLRGVLSQSLVMRSCTGCGGAGCTTCGFTGAAERRLEARLIDLS